MKQKIRWILMLWVSLSMLTVVGAGCSSTATPTSLNQEGEHENQDTTLDLTPVSLEPGQKLQVVATTSIVGDVVKNVGDDRIRLSVLVPLGTDPHAFEPTPRNLAEVADAHVVFANGAGLETFLEPLIESAGALDRVVYLSDDLELLESNHQDTGESEHGDLGADPHTWTDPNNVSLWTRTIERTLSGLDPANAEFFESNARAYRATLTELDAWVLEQVSQIPEAERRIVTDHLVFNYFAARYGFDQVAAIVPGYSTAAEPSVRELAALEDAIRDVGIKAVFVGNTVNPTLAQRVAEDTGTQLVFLYTGSLSGPDGDAGRYVDYTRYNVNAIVDALK